MAQKPFLGDTSPQRVARIPTAEMHAPVTVVARQNIANLKPRVNDNGDGTHKLCFAEVTGGTPKALENNSQPRISINGDGTFSPCAQIVTATDFFGTPNKAMVADYGDGSHALLIGNGVATRVGAYGAGFIPLFYGVAAAVAGLYNALSTPVKAMLTDYFGLRHCGNSYAGALFKVKRSSDNAELDITTKRNKLVYYWPFTNNAIDTRANNAFTVSGNFIYADGGITTADSTGGVLTAYAPTDFTGALRIRARIKCTSLTSALNASVVEIGSYTDNSGFGIFFDNTGRIGLRVNRAFGYVSSPVVIGQWYDLDIVHNGTVCKLYINGVDTQTITSAYAATKIIRAFNRETVAEKFLGTIDYLAIMRDLTTAEAPDSLSTSLEPDTDALLAFAGTGDATISTLYNQVTAARDVVTFGGSPKIVNAGALVTSGNGKLTFEFNGSTDFFTFPALAWQSLALYAGYRSATQVTYATLLGLSNSGLAGTTSGTGSRIANWSGGLSASYHDGNPIVIAGQYDNYNVGVPFTYGMQHSVIDVRINTYSFAPDFSRDKGNNRYAASWFSEFATFSGQVPAGDAQAMSGDARSYWGN